MMILARKPHVSKFNKNYRHVVGLALDMSALTQMWDELFRSTSKLIIATEQQLVKLFHSSYARTICPFLFVISLFIKARKNQKYFKFILSEITNYEFII